MNAKLNLKLNRDHVVSVIHIFLFLNLCGDSRTRTLNLRLYIHRYIAGIYWRVKEENLIQLNYEIY